MVCTNCELRKKKREADKKAFDALGRIIGLLINFFTAIVLLLAGCATIGAGFFVWVWFASRNLEIVGRAFGGGTIMSGAYLIIGGVTTAIKDMVKK